MKSVNRGQSLGLRVSPGFSEDFSSFLRTLPVHPEVFTVSNVGTIAIWRNRPGFTGTDTCRRLMAHLSTLPESDYSWELLDDRCRTVAVGGSYQKGWTSRVRFVSVCGSVGYSWGAVPDAKGAVRCSDVGRSRRRPRTPGRRPSRRPTAGCSARTSSAAV